MQKYNGENGGGLGKKRVLGSGAARVNLDGLPLDGAPRWCCNPETK